MLGHDGGYKPYKDSTLPIGFHPQDCIDICFQLGFSCTEIQYYYGMRPFVGSEETIEAHSLDYCEKRFSYYLTKTSRGVLSGPGKSLGHAVAWDGKLIYDPKNPGKIYPLEDAPKNNFQPQTLWILKRMDLSHA
jgi:hypothetical protein